jgi:hypothetical protein
MSDEDTRTNLRSAWAVECMAWLQTYEVVARRSLSFTPAKKSPITFSELLSRLATLQRRLPLHPTAVESTLYV